MKTKNPRQIEMHNKEMYDRYGREYQKGRNEKWKSRLYNEYLEVPNMIKAVGKIKGKKLLDIGCGAGVHIRHYLKARAKCYGIDFSRTMIEIARRNCPDAEFKIGNMKKLPYKDSSFDIVTCSLAIDYLDRLLPAFREAYRVLKMGGLFYFSTASSINIAKQRYEDRDYKIVGIGEFKDKRKNKQIVLGHAWYEGLVEWEMVPGMIMKTYNRTFRTHLLEIRKAGFELADLIDCKPSKEFKKYDPEEYAALNKFPAFSIYVGIKK